MSEVDKIEEINRIINLIRYYREILKNKKYRFQDGFELDMPKTHVKAIQKKLNELKTRLKQLTEQIE